MAARPIKLKMLPRSTMKVKTATRLTGQVLAGGGVTVVKSGGNFTVSSDGSLLDFPASLVEGDLLVADSDSSLTSLPASTDGYALIANGAAASPSYQGFLQSGVGAVARTWRAKGRDIVSVKDFGAVGNGIANDTSALTAAINSGAKVLVWPEGTYRVSTLTPVSNQAWIGAGKGKTIIKPISTSIDHLVSLSGTIDHADMVFEGITFDCESNAPSTAFFGEYFSRLRIKGCEFKDYDHWGVFIGVNDGVSDDEIRNDNILIEDCDFLHTLTTYEHILVFNAENVTVQNCTFNGDDQGFGIGVFQITENVTIENCFFTGLSAGIYYEISCHDTTIKNCRFDDNAKGIWGGNIGDNGAFGDTVVEDLRVEGCTFKRNVTALELGAIDGATVIDCLFRENDNSIVIDEGNFTSEAPSNLDIIGCRFVNNNAGIGGDVTSILHPGIMFISIGATHVLIDDCRFYDTQGTPSQLYPISFVGADTFSNITVSNCRLSSYSGATSIGVTGGPTLTVYLHECRDVSATLPTGVTAFYGTTNGWESNAALIPTSGGIANLGTPGRSWGGIDLANNAVQRWGNAYTITHSLNLLTFSHALVASSFNGLTVSPSTGTLTVANGKSLTANNTATLTGGDGWTLSVSASKTVTHSATTTFAGTDGKTLTISNSGTLSGGDAWTLSIAASKTLTVSNSGTIAGGDAWTLAIAAGKSVTHNAATTFGGVDLKTLTINTTGTLGGGDAWTLSIAASKTLTVSNTLTFTGTDSSSVAFGAGGTVAYTGNNLSVFAATTSAQLAGVISDETGAGSLVFATETTWTPVITTDGTAGTPAYSIQTGSIEKIGRLRVARFYISLSNWTGSPTGSIRITGLPDAAANVANDPGQVVITGYTVAGLAAGAVGMAGVIIENTTTIIPVQMTSTGTAVVTAAQFGAIGSLIRGTAIYHV